jgi:hypothetical protein
MKTKTKTKTNTRTCRCGRATETPDSDRCHGCRIEAEDWEDHERQKEIALANGTY